jgi:sugar lactone lactonase YvrE
VATIGKHGTGPGELNFSSGIAVGPDGTLYNADWDNSRTQAWDGTDTFLWTFGSKGSKAGQFRSPSDVAVGDDGRIYVADAGRIQVLDSAPSVLGVLRLDDPDLTNLATRGKDVFVSEPFLDRILKLHVIE